MSADDGATVHEGYRCCASCRYFESPVVRRFAFEAPDQCFDCFAGEHPYANWEPYDEGKAD